MSSAKEIEDSIHLLSKLPGLGKRSARRAVLHLINNRNLQLKPLIEALERTYQSVSVCKICGNIDSQNPCSICTNPKKDSTLLCVIEDVADLWAIERSHIYQGHYHVLGGVLSAIDGKGPEDLRIASLETRVKEGEIQEIILATNATVEGQTTAHYITDLLTPYNIKMTRLAQGVPIGGELDYLDEGTLGTALQARRSL